VLPFVALFVFLAAGEERALVETRTSLAGLPVRAAMLTDFHALDVHDPLRRAVEFLMAGSQQDFPVLEDGRLVGLLTRADLIRALQQGGVDTPVSGAVAAQNQWAEAGESLEDVVVRMRAAARSSMPVLSQGHLVGLLTLENVGDLLLVRNALQRWATGGA
jgi:CBS domain-containing protein